MQVIASDRLMTETLTSMLEGYDCPAILVSSNYQIIATNTRYQLQFGDIDLSRRNHCYEVSHGYQVPCDQAGEDCPLAAAQQSRHKERVLHIHQTPRGKEHVDVEMLPLYDRNGELMCFVELLRALNVAGAQNSQQVMVGQSRAFTKMLEHITRVAESEASVLLLGESGSGKELAAKAIHESSKRSDKALVTLECAGLSETLFESELFGHVKGAFTGANNAKKGLVEMADGGTLFLDEVGDVPLSMQVRLLRLLESNTYRQVGSVEQRTANFRLICATNRNLAEMVAAGEFREDLYYRINVFPIAIPDLRSRRTDIPLLVTSLLQTLSPEKAFHLSEPAMQRLMAYEFPGNIRELRNLMNRAIVLADTNIIDLDVIEECIAADRVLLSANAVGERSSLDKNASALSVAGEALEPLVDLKAAERRYLQQLMEACDGDKSLAAKTAGISMRSLYRKLERL